jgi:hypothetical protein
LNVDFIIRHFGNRSVAKLRALGLDILGLEATQAGPLYRMWDGVREELVEMTEVGRRFLGWYA